MSFCTGAPEINNKIWGFQNIRLNGQGFSKEIMARTPILKIQEYPQAWGFQNKVVDMIRASDANLLLIGSGSS